MITRFIRPVLALGALALGGMAVSQRVEAARDFSTPSTTGFEIVVMEVNGCKYCPRFRENVAPAYSASPRGRDVPMRFMDLNAEGADRLRLKSPIDTVPTAVLMHDHAEVGRVEGYVSPEDFARLIAGLLAQN